VKALKQRKVFDRRGNGCICHAARLACPVNVAAAREERFLSCGLQRSGRVIPALISCVSFHKKRDYVNLLS
jgi:hypothetical protein